MEGPFVLLATLFIVYHIEHVKVMVNREHVCMIVPEETSVFLWAFCFFHVSLLCPADYIQARIGRVGSSEQ